MLWPEHDQSGARANLRRELSRLRRAIGSDALDVDREQAAMDAAYDWWLDVDQFKTAVAQFKAHQHPPAQLCARCRTDLAAAVDLYTEPFMAGFSLPDAPTFDEWQFFQASALRQSLAEVLQALIQWHQSRTEFQQAITNGRRWLALDSLHEPAHRTLMRLYAWNDQYAAALRQYEACVRILDEELGVDPETETTTLYETIKRRQLDPPQTVPEEPHPDDGSDAGGADRYQIQDSLANGGHGDLYRGLDRLTGQPVVIKQLKTDVVVKDPQLVNRFQREGALLRRLNHPNIVRILDTFEQDGRHSIVMEYVAGGTLGQLIADDAPLPLPQVLCIGLEVADALSRAHHLGIIHRDVKPDNVLLTEDGTPRLTHFGTARLLREEVRLTQTGAFLGSPAYMSPEALQGAEPDVRSDIWSLGVVLFEMLTGERPFPGEQITATLISILNDPLPDLTQLRPDAPPPLGDLLQHMLAKEPARRVASMRRVAAALEAIRASRPLVTPTTTRTPAPAADAPHNLSPAAAPFVGREEELTQIQKRRRSRR